MSRNKKAATKAFGQDVRVAVTEGEHQGVEGLTNSSTPDGNGDYNIRLDAGNTITVPANSLELVAEEKAPKYSVSVNGGPEVQVDFTELINKLEELRDEGDLPEIKHAQLVNTIHLNYSYDEVMSPGVTDTVGRKGRSPIHVDLRKAFYMLGSHLAVACEEIDPKKVKDIALYDGIPVLDNDGDGKPIYKDDIDQKLKQFVVTGIRFDGQGEKAGVVLIGTKTLSTGDEVKLESPRITWESSYAFLHDLRLASDTLVDEVQLYKLGKQAPAVVQAELEFGMEEEAQAEQPA